MTQHDYRDYRGLLVDTQWVKDFFEDHKLDEQSLRDFLGEDSDKEGIFLEFITSLLKLKNFITSDQQTINITRIREIPND